MRIEFRLVTSNKAEQEITDDFCESLVKRIREDILSKMIPAKMVLLEQDLLEATWIEWTRKPMHIDMIKLVNLIVSKIGYVKRYDGTYSICINPGAMMPGSRTRLERIARFLDKGTEKVPVTTFISRVFNDYGEHIDEHWDNYVFYRTKKHRTSKAVLII